MPVFIYIFSFLIFSGLISEDWKLIKQKDSISVYTRKTDESKYEQIKIITEVNAKLSEVVFALEDVDNHKDWAYSTNESYIIEKRKPNEFDYYITIDMPFPVRDRDLVVRYNRVQNSATKDVVIHSIAKSGIKENEDGYVRITDFHSIYTIKKLGQSKVQIEYFLNADPAGSIPAWVVNLFTTKGPIESMTTLKHGLESGKYNHKNAIGIVD